MLHYLSSFLGARGKPGESNKTCYNIIIIFCNGIFDTELVHFYLSDSVQMSIKNHYDPEIQPPPPQNCKNMTRHSAHLGA